MENPAYIGTYRETKANYPENKQKRTKIPQKHHGAIKMLPLSSPERLKRYYQGKVTEEKIKEVMDKETLLGPDDALELGVIDEIAGRTSIAVDEAMQSTKKINEMKDKIKQSNFADQLKEFEELVKPEEQEDDVSMETFFNMFSL